MEISVKNLFIAKNFKRDVHARGSKGDKLAMSSIYHQFISDKSPIFFKNKNGHSFDPLI